MRTILVDDNLWMLKGFEIECRNIIDIEIVGEFADPLEALDYAKKQPIDLAFLDVEMPHMSGLDLSDALRKLYPEIIIVFVSGHDKYMADAICIRDADYYIIKPFTEEDVRAVLKRAKLLSKRQEKKIYIETFGRFNVYVDGDPIRFTSSVAKELLAIMVHKRDTILTTEEAFRLMWEDRPFDHSTAVSFHKAMRKLKDTLEEAGISNLVIQISPSEHKVNTELFDCDYYQFIKKDPSAIRKYNGEYMAEWSWSEITNGFLTAQKREYEKSAY